MALVLADRVRETTTVTGTGTATLLGAVSGYQSFAAVGNANTTYYVIANQSASEWEVGIGTYTASGTTLSRDTVLSSSNSGSLVNFSAGTKDVFVDYPAGRAVYEDAAGNVDGYPITGGTINNTVIGGTTPAAGTFTTLTATGQTSLGGVAGAEGLRVLNTASSTRYLTAQGSTADEVYLTASGPSGSNVALALSSRATGAVRFYTNTANQEQMRVSHTASAVNYVQVTGAATGARPTISAQGSDATAGLNIYAKGGSSIFFSGNANNIAFGISHVSSATNYIAVAPSVAGSAPVLSAQGTDTNISQVFQSKGTGAIDLAAGSSGINISNGGTVTALTRTAGGTGYTSSPTVAISAPTTAGGVQATATVAVSAGAITTFTITNAGSGYVEQPTVSFSGGGGSGAAAYASVGSSTVIKTLGSTATTSGISFQTPAGEQVRITDSGNTAVNYIGMWGGSSGVAPRFVARGTDTDVSLLYSVKGAGNHVFRTNDANQTQFQVSHTASAVNYVQVTGATTTNTPLISAQGSDTNIGLRLQSKGSFGISYLNSSGGLLGAITHSTTTASTNYISLQAVQTGNAPAVASSGSDTNIDLTLTPKGTGAVRDVTGGGEQLRVSNTASAVNYVNITGAATGNPGVCFISAQGSDTNISLASVNKGTGAFSWFNGGSTGSRLFRVNGGATNMANHLQIDAAAAGSFPSLSVGSLSADTNVDLALIPKGTGNVRFGTYTGTISAITGYIEIKDSGGTVRRLAVVA